MWLVTYGMAYGYVNLNIGIAQLPLSGESLNRDTAYPLNDGLILHYLIIGGVMMLACFVRGLFVVCKVPLNSVWRTGKSYL